MKYKTNIRKQWKLLHCSRKPVYGVSGGQENRLDVTNPHTERFFKNLKNRPAVGVWYRLVFLLNDWKTSNFRSSVRESVEISKTFSEMRIMMDVVRLFCKFFSELFVFHLSHNKTRLNSTWDSYTTVVFWENVVSVLYSFYFSDINRRNSPANLLGAGLKTSRMGSAKIGNNVYHQVRFYPNEDYAKFYKHLVLIDWENQAQGCFWKIFLIFWIQWWIMCLQ